MICFVKFVVEIIHYKYRESISTTLKKYERIY